MKIKSKTTQFVPDKADHDLADQVNLTSPRAFSQTNSDDCVRLCNKPEEEVQIVQGEEVLNLGALDAQRANCHFGWKTG